MSSSISLNQSLIPPPLPSQGVNQLEEDHLVFRVSQLALQSREQEPEEGSVSQEPGEGNFSNREVQVLSADNSSAPNRDEEENAPPSDGFTTPPRNTRREIVPPGAPLRPSRSFGPRVPGPLVLAFGAVEPASPRTRRFYEFWLNQLPLFRPVQDSDGDVNMEE